MMRCGVCDAEAGKSWISWSFGPLRRGEFPVRPSARRSLIASNPHQTRHAHRVQPDLACASRITVPKIWSHSAVVTPKLPPLGE